jgi:hypothetical protein
MQVVVVFVVVLVSDTDIMSRHVKTSFDLPVIRITSVEGSYEGLFLCVFCVLLFSVFVASPVLASRLGVSLYVY